MGADFTTTTKSLVRGDIVKCNFRVGVDPETAPHYKPGTFLAIVYHSPHDNSLPISGNSAEWRIYVKIIDNSDFCTSDQHDAPLGRIIEVGYDSAESVPATTVKGIRRLLQNMWLREIKESEALPTRQVVTPTHPALAA